MKDFADDNLKCDENGGKFSKSVENTIRKRVIATYEQFLFLLQCFQNTRTTGTLKQRLIVESITKLLKVLLQ